MKLTMVALEGSPQVVLVDDSLEHFWLVSDLIPGFQGDMLDLIEHYPDLGAQLQARGEGADLATAKMLAPLPRGRRNIFCVGKNYHEHAEEFGKSGFDSSTQSTSHIPDAPVVFTKPFTAVIATGEAIPAHAGVTSQLDYEAEVAVIIGKRGRGISRAQAMDHVFGYTIINDFTARDLQKKHKQWHLAKSLDGFCPMGPCIVTAGDVDGSALDVRCWVNGELRQEANTRQLIFDIPTLIETISAGITLLPGDVIATGTPAGVGIGFNPPRFVQSGDCIRIAVDGIGVLENGVS